MAEGQAQKSVQRPFCSQSPNRVGSGPAGPPISFSAGGLGGVGRGSGVASVSMSRIWSAVPLAPGNCFCAALHGGEGFGGGPAVCRAGRDRAASALRRILRASCLGAAAFLQRTGPAVLLRGPAAHEALGIDAGPRLLELPPAVHQFLAGRADVEVALVVVGEVGAAERAVLAGRLVEHRYVRPTCGRSAPGRCTATPSHAPLRSRSPKRSGTPARHPRACMGLQARCARCSCSGAVQPRWHRPRASRRRARRSLPATSPAGVSHPPRRPRTRPR